MTFKEWFEKEYWPIDGEDWNPNVEERMVTNMRKAWEAGYETGGRAQVEWQDYLDRYDD